MNENCESKFKGLPEIGSVVIFNKTGNDVKIKAHTFVANKPAAVWQFYDEFGYGFVDDFSEEETNND